MNRFAKFTIKILVGVVLLIIVIVLCGGQIRYNTDGLIYTNIEDGSSLYPEFNSVPEGYTTEQDEEEYTVNEDNILSENINCIIPANLPPQYQDYLAKYPFEFYHYTFVYIDDDNNPELVLDGGCEANGYLVLSCRENQIIVLQTERHSFSYIERSGLCGYQNGSMGHYYTRCFNLTESGFFKYIDYDVNEETNKIELKYNNKKVNINLFDDIYRKEFLEKGKVIDIDSITSWQSVNIE